MSFVLPKSFINCLYYDKTRTFIHNNFTIIDIIECNVKPLVSVYCEPQLGKRKLYPLVSKKGVDNNTRAMMNFISYCDGNNTLLEIADMIGKPFSEVKVFLDKLIKHKLISIN